MNILILNGNPDTNNASFERYLASLTTGLENDHNDVTPVKLRERRIVPCSGCLDCWVKSPGECPENDEIKDIRRMFIHSNLVIIASPLIAGFISALSKNTIDKMMPLLQPYITIVRGEMRHRKRYDSYPLFGLIHQSEPVDTEDEKITTDIVARMAMNFHSDLAFSFSLRTPVNEVLDEIDSY